MNKKDIKSLRLETGLTQVEFAKKVGVSVVLVAMTETGQKRVSLNYLQKLANAFRREIIVTIKPTV